MIKSLNFQDLRQKAMLALDSRVRAITAGLGLNELRAVLRGDPPTEKPNPRYKVHTTSFLFHIRPRYYQKGSTIFTHTFRLGFFTAFFFFVELFTGLILMVYYSPTPSEAYSSILYIMANVPFGNLMRDLHRLGAEAMVIFTVLHMARTYLTGSYKKDRSFTWLTGVVLLGLTLFLSFFGYLLPWDQLAYWAITVSTNLMAYVPLIGVSIRNFFLGGPLVGQSALNNFYALHVVFLPVVLIIFMSYHFWKVRKNGGISQPIKKEGERVERLSTIPNLINIEMAAALVVISLVIVWSMIKPAPLGPIANPFQSPNPAKAAWYFVGLQELLLHMHPLAALSLVAVLAAGLMATPFIDRMEADIGIFFRSDVGKRAALWGALLGINLTPLAVVLDEYWLDIPALLPGLPSWISIGVIPFAATVGLFFLVYAALRRSKLLKDQAANHSEALLGVFAFATAGLLVLTICGVFFRGANMALVLPF
jgi:quinol-cytochrome oxidoreductase complex cytochrome b subunit